MESDFTQKQLRRALTDGDVNEVMDLINSGDVDVNFRDVTHDLQTFLMNLCYVKLDISSTNRILNSILEQHDVNIAIQDSWGRTALMHACISNKPVIIERLLECPDVKADMLDFDGNSALAYAVQNCDIYTIEDLLHHPGGSSLLNVANSKGHTPYSTAQRSGDKAICKLMDAFLNKTICLQDKKKHRKARNRDITKLPATNSPSHERKLDSYDSPRHRKPPVHITRDFARLELQCGDSSDKSDSAQTVRRNIVTETETDEAQPGLVLTSAKLSRNHHKQDSLSNTKMLLNPENSLPSLGKHQGNDFDGTSYSRKRRGSISLPDLRDMTGCLVNSGNNTPTGRKKDISTPSSSDDSDNDNVFSQSLPSSRAIQLCSEAKASTKPRRPQKQLTLPEINTSFSSLTSPQISSKSLSTLVRGRKYSSNDDLQRVVLLQKTT